MPYYNKFPNLVGDSMGPLSITGGVITDSGGFRTHKFLSSADIVVTGTGLVDICLVAGGGSSINRGGGGAGEVVQQFSVKLKQGYYTLTVGNGGTASVDNAGDSSITQYGIEIAKANRGRIGGSTGPHANSGGNGGTPGRVGGNGNANAGGGGAGSAGNGTAASGGNQDVAGYGGVGTTCTIDGVVRASGGQGTGAYQYSANPGGGGNPNADATANTGGGAGGGNRNGGSGIIIIKYAL